MTHPADALREQLEKRKSAAAERTDPAGDNGQSAPVDPATTTDSKEETVSTAKSASKAKAAKATAKKAKPAKKATRGNGKGKPAKKAAAKPAKKRAKKAASKSNGKSNGAADRKIDRDKDGDGLRPIERTVITAVADEGEPLSIVGLAHRMFGENCGSEGPESVRTIRNAARVPVRFGILESGGRGKLQTSTAYKRAKGDVSKVIKNYHARQKRVAAKAAKATEASA